MYVIVEPVEVAEPVARLLLAARLLGFVVLPLLTGIALMVYARYDDSSLIQGFKSSPNDRFAFLQAYTTNTLEQTALHALSLVAFCAVVPEPLLVFAYAQVAAFLFGRLMFFVGYQRTPMHRLVGFAVGYYPAIAALGASCLYSLRAAA